MTLNYEVVLKDPNICEWKNDLEQYHVSYDGRLWVRCYINSFKHKEVKC